ncbi:MAG: type II/IV secretion system protein [Phycisphaeraceae bacterium]|nr:type II/IV secretion system protein [Phycisphaeraceae bacterium]
MSGGAAIDGEEATALGLPSVWGSPSREFLELIPMDFARLHGVLSAGRDEGVERLWVLERTKRHVAWNVGVRLGVSVEKRNAEEAWLAARIDEAYQGVRGMAAGEEEGRDGAAGTGSEEYEEGVARAMALSDRDVLVVAGKAPIVRLVDAMLFEAARMGASDVHVQPVHDRVLVRMRVDGVLHTTRELARGVAEALCARIKVMGRMDVAEVRVPQDGRASIAVGSGAAGRAIDLRISSLPTSHGERIVVRLLDGGVGRELAGLDVLGMPREVHERYVGLVTRPQGVVLLTGPTGSGKTTTLYATLRLAADGSGERKAGDCGLNIMTIEDPIEYELASLGLAVSQSQVNAKKGVTFASGLRHILRQDPDVVMIGEIRDEQTARIAIQASLTGHLVLSTLHTNSAAGAVSRLSDLGVEPFLVASSLSGVMAQRLVRRVHRECEGRGCERCLRSGFLGRVGLFELLVCSARIREMVVARAGERAILDQARAAGMRTLREEGLRLADLGITTEREAMRVTMAEDES